MYCIRYVNFQGRILISLIRIWSFFLMIFLMLLININVRAADNYQDDLFYNLPALFNQNNWIKSKNDLIIYLLNFQEIDRELIETNSLYGYFSGNSTDLETSWQYSGQEGLIEIKDISNRSNSLITSNLNSVFNEGNNYSSWLAAYEDNISKIVLRERYIGSDRVKQSWDDRLLDISLIPKNISYDKQQILTEVNFQYGSKSKGNKVDTVVWVGDSHVETIAVIAKKIDKNDIKRRRYFALQLAAVVVPAEQLFSTDGSFLAIGNINGLNKIFDNSEVYDSVGKRGRDSISIGVGNNGEEIIFNLHQGENSYSVELNRFREYQWLNYLIKTDLSLVEREGLFLSIRVSNENNILNIKNQFQLSDKNRDLYKPVIRIGLVDQINWDNFIFALSYYPLSIQTKKQDNILIDDLWQLSALYRNDSWCFQYKGEFTGNRKKQEINLEYLLGEGKSISLTYGMNYDNKDFYSLHYNFPLW